MTAYKNRTIIYSIGDRNPVSGKELTPEQAALELLAYVTNRYSVGHSKAP